VDEVAFDEPDSAAAALRARMSKKLLAMFAMCKDRISIRGQFRLLIFDA
jgi:hypothetical protein